MLGLHSLPRRQSGVQAGKVHRMAQTPEVVQAGKASEASAAYKYIPDQGQYLPNQMKQQ